MAKIMTKRQSELIEDNLRAFTTNFGAPKIEKAEYGGGYFVYYPADSKTYIQYCYDINYLNGWLYGVVQGFLRGEFKKGAEQNG